LDANPTLSPDPDDLIQARMLNEFCYCPRLFHLMRVEGRWADNEYTVDGQVVHRVVDGVERLLPLRETSAAENQESDSASDSEANGAAPAEGDPQPVVVQSVTISSPRLGLIAKLDLVEVDGGHATPVDYKRGRVPENELQSWEPERVQLMAQALLLREQGYRCDKGLLYFAESRRRVEVRFDDALEARTLELLRQAQAAARRRVPPPPLVGSPKCVGCSLSGICLPDETDALLRLPADAAAPGVRRHYPSRPDSLPLYVQDPGATVGKSDQSLVVRQRGGAETRVLLKDISQLVLMGPVAVTAQATHLLCEAGVPIVHLSSGGWFHGMTTGFALRNSFARVAQYEAAQDPARALECAKEFVLAKLQNQRTLLKRNAALEDSDTLRDFEVAMRAVPACHDLAGLLGAEGSGAAAYFRRFNLLLRSPIGPFEFESRNRRPPRDPVNAMLSFAYAMLAKEVTVAIAAEGLDPWWGLYHQPRHGRPSLALDLMEEFRPVIADSAVITAVNTGMLGPEDFITAAGSCALRPAGRKSLIRAFEARLDQMVTHPVFDYRCSWRQIIVLQVRLLSKWLRRELPAYKGMTTR
jgi:CRISPR-associated protein Cas1